MSSKSEFPKEEDVKLKINGQVLSRADINPIVKRKEQVPVMPVRVKPTNISKSVEDSMKTVNPQLSIIPKKIPKKGLFLESILSTDDDSDSSDSDEEDDHDVVSEESVDTNIGSYGDDLYIEIPIESLPESDRVPRVPLVPLPPIPPVPVVSPPVPPVPAAPTYVRKIVKTKKKVIKKAETTRPDYAKLSDNERAVHRLNFKNKFELIKRWYPSLSVPKDVEDHQDLDYIHSVYEVCLNFMYQQINSSFYRGALLMSWIALEAAGTLWLGLDVSGYCQQQMDMLWVYEPLINEMSKVDLTIITEGWSPFQKIIALVVGSFALMIFVRMVVGKMGTAVGMNLSGFSGAITGFITNMFTQKPQPASQVEVSAASPSSVHGLATMPIQPPPRSADNQLGMAQDAMRMMHLVSGGKAGTAPGPSAPVVQPKMPSPPSQQPQASPARKTVIKKPQYDS